MWGYRDRCLQVASRGVTRVGFRGDEIAPRFQFAERDSKAPYSGIFLTMVLAYTKARRARGTLRRHVRISFFQQYYSVVGQYVLPKVHPDWTTGRHSRLEVCVLLLDSLRHDVEFCTRLGRGNATNPLPGFESFQRFSLVHKEARAFREE